MKKTIAIITIVSAFFLIPKITLAQESNGLPFKILWNSVNNFQEKVKSIEKSLQEYIANIDQKISEIVLNINSLSDDVDDLKQKNRTMEEQIATISDYLNQTGGFNSGSEEGIRKKVYTGTVPDNLDDADLDIKTSGSDEDHYYLKKVEIPELNLSDMPQITLYAKARNEIANATEEDFWRVWDELLIKDGAVYIIYANDSEDGVYYYFQGDRSYKIVVVY